MKNLYFLKQENLISSNETILLKILKLLQTLRVSNFIGKLENALVKAVETHARNVLFYVVLDNFNAIKENVGIVGVDPVIENIGKVLSSFSEEGILARFDESTFTLLMTDKEGKKHAAAGELANKICKAISESVTEIGEQSVLAMPMLQVAQKMYSKQLIKRVKMLKNMAVIAMKSTSRRRKKKTH